MKAQSKIQKPLTSKQLPLSAAERYPGPVPPLFRVRDARTQLTDANAFLREARNSLFHKSAAGYLRRLLKKEGDFAKRKELHVIAEALQATGFYSAKVATSSVEHMVMTRLYRFNASLGNLSIVPIGLFNPPDSVDAWKRFCDTVAGESYWNCVPYAVIEATHTAAKAKTR